MSSRKKLCHFRNVLIKLKYVPQKPIKMTKCQGKNCQCQHKARNTGKSCMDYFIKLIVINSTHTKIATCLIKILDSTFLLILIARIYVASDNRNNFHQSFEEEGMLVVWLTSQHIICILFAIQKTHLQCCTKSPRQCDHISHII